MVTGKRKATRKILILLFFSLLSLLTACSRSRIDWIRFRGEGGRGATSNALHPPLGIKWKLRLQREGDRAPAFNAPIVKGDTIYFGSSDGNFYALDIGSGYMRWVFRTEGMINSVPFADDRKVYFGSNDGKVYAVSLEKGKQAWAFQAESTVQSTVVRHEDSVIFTSDGGSTYFLTPEGELQHKIPNPVWHRDTFQVFENVMYFAPGPLSRPHSLGAFDIRQKYYLWTLNTGAMGATWYSFPALQGRAIHFGTCAYSRDHWRLNYYAFDRETGVLLWRYGDQSYFGEGTADSIWKLFRKNLDLLDYMAPSLWRNLVVYTSGDSVVRAFRARDGTPVWRRVFDFPTSSAPTIAGDRIYFGLHGADTLPGDAGSTPQGRKPRLVCLSVRNGSKLWEMELDGALLSAPVISGKWLIFGTDTNMFYVLEELY